MSGKGTEKRVSADDVEVHITAGCDLRGCGRTDRHYHTQKAWRRHINAVGRRMGL